MKIPKKIRNITIALGLGLALYTFNASAIPIAVKHGNFFKEVDNPKVQILMGIKKWNSDYTHDYKEKGEKAALKYLKLAHVITAGHISDTQEFSLTESNKSIHKGFCYEMSVYTYSNFLSLIKTADKNDLKDFVRVAAGHAVYNDLSTGHVWLEIKLNGKWTPYETTMLDTDQIRSIDPECIDDLVPDSDTTGFQANYTRTNTFQVDKSGKNSKLDLIGVLKDYRGALGKLR